MNGLHVLVQSRPSVKGRRTYGASEYHLSDLHDVGRPVLLGVTLRHVLQEGIGVVEVDVAVVTVIVRSGSAGVDDGVSVFLLKLCKRKTNELHILLGIN